MSNENFVLTVDEKRCVTLTVTNSCSEQMRLGTTTWKSDDESVATVGIGSDLSYVIYGQSPGTTVVRVTVTDRSGYLFVTSFNVTVNGTISEGPPVNSIRGPEANNTTRSVELTNTNHKNRGLLEDLLWTYRYQTTGWTISKYGFVYVDKNNKNNFGPVSSVTFTVDTSSSLAGKRPDLGVAFGSLNIKYDVGLVRRDWLASTNGWGRWHLLKIWTIGIIYINTIYINGNVLNVGPDELYTN